MIKTMESGKERIPAFKILSLRNKIFFTDFKILYHITNPLHRPFALFCHAMTA